MIGKGARMSSQAQALEAMTESARRHKRHRYVTPTAVGSVGLSELLERIGRVQLRAEQLDLLRPTASSPKGKNVTLYYTGRLELLEAPCVSIVGTRDVSDAGRSRAHRLASELAHAGVTVVSGLARGVDFAAHESAIRAGGKTVAVIGTPLTKAYPAENAFLQELIYREHLLLSPFRDRERVFRSNFPKRNRVMAAVSDATVIIEASDTSGTLHQAAECQRLGRWLFIAKSVAVDPSLSWPADFLGKPKTAVLSSSEDLIGVLGDGKTVGS